MFVNIKSYERGLLFKNGNYKRCLGPGKYFFNPMGKYRVFSMDVTKPFEVPDIDLNIFIKDEELLRELVVTEVKDHQIGLHYEDGRFAGVLTSGKHAFWNVLKAQEVVIVDTREPEVSDEIDISIFAKPGLYGHYYLYQVKEFETGILYLNNRFAKILGPGAYYFWRGPVAVEVEMIDLRQQHLDMTGQEIMTLDKVALRLNFVCQYKIVDAQKLVSIKDYEKQIYILLQLILREYVGTLKFDQLLENKTEIGSYVLDRLKDESEGLGINFIYAGVKDIILPGEVREILNTVLIAEKQAQASVISRREETASTRSLLNTAKLMDENTTLYKLKELEYLERICDKVGNISLSGGNLLEQLSSLVAGKDN